MKYTLPFLLCILIRLVLVVVVTIHQIYSFSFPKRHEKDSIEASWLKQRTFLHSDEAKNSGNNSLGACAWLYKLGFGLNLHHFFASWLPGLSMHVS